MRAHFTSLLIGALALGACQAGLPSSKKPIESASKSAQPLAPIKAGSGTLPAIASIPLSGVLRVDAHYVVAAGGGNVVASGGANVVAAGGANVVAAGGANAVASGGANFRVLGAELPIGTILPAQGFEVRALSLLTGQPIGKPALTDATGTFKLAIPEDQKANVLLEARLPNSADPRMRYLLVTSPQAGVDRQIDEDTALTTKYLRQCIVARLVSLFESEAAVEANLDTFSADNRVPEAVKAITLAALTEIQTRAKAAGVHRMPEAQRVAIAQRFIDIILGEVDLKTIMVQPDGSAEPGAAPEPALVAMDMAMAEGRQATRAKLLLEPGYFAGDAFYQATQARWEVKKPADYGDRIVEIYVAGVGKNSFDRIRTINAAIGMSSAQSKRMIGAALTIGQHISQMLILNKRVRDKALTAFDAPAGK